MKIFPSLSTSKDLTTGFPSLSGTLGVVVLADMSGQQRDAARQTANPLVNELDVTNLDTVVVPPNTTLATGFRVSNGAMVRLASDLRRAPFPPWPSTNMPACVVGLCRDRNQPARRSIRQGSDGVRGRWHWLVERLLMQRDLDAVY